MTQGPYLSGQHTLPALLAALRDPQAAPALRWGAALDLGWLGDVRALPDLLAALHEPAFELRQSAIWALGQMQVGEAVEHLAPLLYDEDESVRFMAGLALVSIGTRDALAALQQAAEGENEPAARAAGSALVVLRYLQAGA